ncbi:MAG: sugar ABC transporter permease [Lachnospiraceae bacterium]|jgi:multiple sugar transport system permease protein|nr:sugar ABC transporter permease [Lachnospiraceae bacterium]MCH4069997.1 sugar ABC transporter permease [Lachnospiraceae bacterium]MCH4108649.1 sugar ABC transporter permease [Lachnospiraceae bacterium]MCI1302801.1 sugar ABC transporter permease [Lachnospiraceae bacterium]MCI1332062.1 sugar ABC transporter permease [Lachnospiraceae bacterium]
MANGNSKLKTVHSAHKRENMIGWTLNIPYLAYTVFLFLIPLCWAVWLSLQDWNLMSSSPAFVGFKNFADLFRDKNVGWAFLNSFRYLIPIVILCLIFGLIIAFAVNALPEKVRGFASVAMFIPYLTSGVATAVLAKYMLSYNSVLNTFLRTKFGLAISWFTNGTSAFLVIVFIVVWKCSGYYALFFLSALSSIPQEVIEAAQIDGATRSQINFKIKIPMMLSSISSVVALAAGLALSIYTEPYLLTGGGPADATTTWTLEIYYSAFTKFQSGYGTAMAIVYAVEIFVILKLIDWIMGKLIKRFGC